jgi:hypothetical protein
MNDPRVSRRRFRLYRPDVRGERLHFEFDVRASERGRAAQAGSEATASSRQNAGAAIANDAIYSKWSVSRPLSHEAERQEISIVRQAKLNT